MRQFRKNILWDRVKTKGVPATPEDAPNIIKEFNVPYKVDVLKIDIDSRDLMEAWLKVVQPKVIIIESHNVFPPPCKYVTGPRGWCCYNALRMFIFCFSLHCREVRLQYLAI